MSTPTLAFLSVYPILFTGPEDSLRKQDTLIGANT